MKEKFSEIFKRDFYQKMLTPGHPANPTRNRADSFLKVFQLLEEKTNIWDYYFRIVETGCARKDHGELSMGDDGASSFLFDQFLKYNEGKLISVDINEDNVNYTRSIFGENSKNSSVYCEDSVKFLYDNFNTGNTKIDLLYLDSYDITIDNPHPSQLHHLMELCAVIPSLKAGSIIVVDDHNAFFTDPPIGKGNYIKSFMSKINAKNIFEDYQIGWIIT